ncbi:MAG: DUF2339 domain-containing protein [Sedimentisphaerales bacterium]|nr:DUF2339 domain-containing protein [Sedimentisphaerales bacterium]
MEEIACIVVPLVIVVISSGPIALILSIVALNKVKEIRGRLERKSVLQQFTPEVKMPPAPPFVSQPPSFRPVAPIWEKSSAFQPPPTKPVEPATPIGPGATVTPVKPAPPPSFFEETKPPPPPFAEPKPPPAPTPHIPAQPIPVPQVVIRQTTEKTKKAMVSLEQRIGTRWVLIAGVITVFISAAFFLKFAYDNYWIGPWGRIGIAIVAGLASLVVGEITRRRGYEIAAKGTTALGFAILYAADFTAYRFYELIGTVPAFGTAIIITAAAMTYAVVLNEVIAVFLALLGGFLTPVIVSTGENLPVPLFSYVLVLSCGAMLCAYWRKWRAINLLAFAGTLLLYTGWFEKFFRSQLYAVKPPAQMAIALGWLGIFFVVYLVLPLLYGLVNKVNARKDDVLLAVINAAWTFYYLWTILFERNQTGLALCAGGLSAAHLAMMGLVFIRCRDDKALRQTLLVIGLAFLTTAIPLYWRMNAVILSWAVEGAILVFIGIRYRSILTQIGGVSALVLACLKLILQLPIHTDVFRLVFNSDFGIWAFVSAALFLCHFWYRRDSRSPGDSFNVIAQIFYAVGVLVLFCAATLEWAAHCEYNLLVGTGLHFISRGQLIIFAAAVLFFAVWPVCPRGRVTQTFAFITLTAGMLFSFCALFALHTERFTLFANWNFAAVLVFVGSILFCHTSFRLAAQTPENREGILSQVLYAVAVLVLFCAATFEWAAHCEYNLQVGYDLHFISRGQSIIFAAAVLLFAIRPICPRGRPTQAFSIITLMAGVVFVACAIVRLHTGKFLIFLNRDFAAVLVFIMSILICHIKHRRLAGIPQSEAGILSQVLYAVAMLVLISTVSFEWAAHCKYNLLAGTDLHFISRGQSVIFAAAVLLFAIRPFCPRGRATEVFFIITLITGVIFIAFALTRLHTGKFIIFVNYDFAVVFIFVMSMLCCHIKYRLTAESGQNENGSLSQVIYTVMGLMFLAAIAAEWYWHCVYNLGEKGISPQLIRGQIIVFAAGVLGFVIRPLCPRGALSRVWAAGLAVVGSCFMVILYSATHDDAFYIFANSTFIAAVGFIDALFLSAYLLYRRKDDEPEVKPFAVMLSVLAIIVLWIVLSEEIYEYWRCRNLYGQLAGNWRFIAHMWMSVAWAIYGLVLLIGGFWRKLEMLRYLGLCVLGLLLLKAFIVDMSAVSTIYRIMAFLATGVTLVGVSYLYQFLKKKGFFET